jgi:hypothetical protein
MRPEAAGLAAGVKITGSSLPIPEGIKIRGCSLLCTDHHLIKSDKLPMDIYRRILTHLKEGINGDKNGSFDEKT